MLIIYGLGNNENKYLKTKHNIGRVVVEGLATKLDKSFGKKNLIWSTQSGETLLAYSNGYMNESGLPLLQLIKYYKPEQKELLILIIQDDSDQFIGNAKLLPAGGTAGHRGIISINKHLSSFNLNILFDNLQLISQLKITKLQGIINTLNTSIC